jgi:hypothetical protein
MDVSTPSVSAIEFTKVWSRMREVPATQAGPDTVRYNKLTTCGLYIARSSYKLFFLGRLEVLIRLKRIYNFWFSMLVYAPFALCFFTLCGIFMRFLELTYWRDATVSVPCFLLFLCFRKVTQEIFSELDKTKPEPPIFLGRKTKTEGEPKGARGPTTPGGGAPPSPLGCTRGWCGAPGHPLTPPLRLYKSFRHQNPRSFGVFWERVLQLCRCHRRNSGDRSLYSGILPG